MTVSFVGTTYLHEHGSHEVGRAERTITTSDGFVGHGTDSFVINGRILKFRLTDGRTALTAKRVTSDRRFAMHPCRGPHDVRYARDRPGRAQHGKGRRTRR